MVKGLTEIWTFLGEENISGTVTLVDINRILDDHYIDVEAGEGRELLYTTPLNRAPINGPRELSLYQSLDSHDGDGVREPLITNSSSSSRGCSTRTVVLASVCSALCAAAITVGALYETGHLK